MSGSIVHDVNQRPRNATTLVERCSDKRAGELAARQGADESPPVAVVSLHAPGDDIKFRHLLGRHRAHDGTDHGHAQVPCRIALAAASKPPRLEQPVLDVPAGLNGLVGYGHVRQALQPSDVGHGPGSRAVAAARAVLGAQIRELQRQVSGQWTYTTRWDTTERVPGEQQPPDNMAQARKVYLEQGDNLLKHGGTFDAADACFAPDWIYNIPEPPPKTQPLRLYPVVCEGRKGKTVVPEAAWLVAAVPAA